MDQIGHSEIKDTASYRHSLYLSEGSKLDDVYALFKGFKSEYFIVAQAGDDVIGYIEWGKRQPKGTTIKREDPDAEWYVRDGKAGEVVEYLRSLRNYEEGEQEMGKRTTPVLTTPTSRGLRSPRKSKGGEAVREGDLPTMLNELEIKRLVEQVDKVEKALQESKANEEKLRGEVLVLKKEKETLEIQAKKFAGLRQECDEVSDEIIAEKERNKTLTKRVNELETDVKQANKLLSKKTEGYESLKQELETEREKMDRYKTESKKRGNEYVENIRQKFRDECQEPIRLLKEEIGEKDNEIKELKARLSEPSKVIDIYDFEQEGHDGQVGLYVGDGVLKGSYFCYQGSASWMPCQDKPPKNGPWYSTEGKKMKDRQGNWVLDR